MAKQQAFNLFILWKPREEVNILIAGQSGEHICDECIEHAQNHRIGSGNRKPRNRPKKKL